MKRMSVPAGMLRTLLLEEAGQTTRVTLSNPTPDLKKQPPLTEFELKAKKDAIEIISAKKENVGKLTGPIHDHLLPLLRKGSRFRATLIGHEGNITTLLLREVHRSPRLANEPPFASFNPIGALTPFFRLPETLDEEELTTDEEETLGHQHEERPLRITSEEPETPEGQSETET